MVSTKKYLIILLVIMMVASACVAAPAVTEEAATLEAPATSSSTEAPVEAEVAGELVIYSGRSEPLIQPVIDAFKAKYPNVEVLLKAGSNSELANALLEEQANPQA